MDALSAIRDSPVGRSLSDAALTALVERAGVTHLAAGETLYRRGDPASTFAVVVSGTLGIYLQDGEIERRVDGVGAGLVVGESALAPGGVRNACVRADDDASVVIVDVARDGGPWLGALGLQLVGIMRDRVEGANERSMAALRRELEAEVARVSIARFLVVMLAGLALYTVALGIMLSNTDNYLVSNIASAAGIAAFAVVVAIMAWNSALPAAFFGITPGARWVRDLVEAVLLSVAVCAALTVLKAVVAAFAPAFAPVIAPEWTTLSVGLDRVIFTAIYVALVPVQEFIARGVLQSSLVRLMSGWKHPALWSVVLSSSLFAASHAHISPLFPPITLVAGLLWGAMYARSGSLLGPCVSHVIIGVYGLEILDASALLRL